MAGIGGTWGVVVGIFAASVYLTFVRRRRKFSSTFDHEEPDSSSSWQEGMHGFQDPQPDQVVISNVAFQTFFQVAGYIAKSDGRVSAEEISLATELMERLSLTRSNRELAIECFNEGKEPNFNLSRCLDRIHSTVGINRLAGMVLFEAMVQVSEADGLTNEKIDTLIRYARAVGVREQEAQAFIRQRKSQWNDHSYEQTREQQHSSYQQSNNSVTHAYRILGVNENESDSEVKMAYRRLMQQSHPDRLQAMNLPDFLMDAAKRKTQEVQDAWETVKSVRGIN